MFITAAVSLVPLAGLIGLGTEQLARRSGPALGGFLNATFGNAAELIIAVVALRSGHIELVKASITGSIVGNLLLVLGLSFFVGGLGRRSQKFHRTAATNTAAMLFLGVVALVMPAVFDLSLYGSLDAHPPAIDRLSFWSALVLIVAYAGSLIYAFTAHRDLFRSEPRRRARRPACSTPARPSALLAAGTVLTTVQAEMLVGALEPALARFGFTELFVGVIVVAHHRQRRRALLGGHRRAARRDDAGGRDRRRQQRADRAAGRAGAGAVFVRDRPADVAAVQRVRDRGDRAVGAGDVDRRRSTARATGSKGCSCCRSI